MAQIKTRGIIIGKKDFGEADRLFTILTSDRGKVRAIAKGIRRPKARLVGALDLFSDNEFTLVVGKNFDVIVGANRKSPTVELSTLPWSRLGVLYYVCEITNKLLEETHEVTGVFELMAECFTAARGSKLHEDLIRSGFELRLMTLLGWAPAVHKDVHTGKDLDSSAKVYFSATRGGVFQSETPSEIDEMAYPISLSAVKLLRLLSRYPLPVIEKVKVSPDVIAEVSAMSAGFMAHFADVRIKSLPVVAELQ